MQLSQAEKRLNDMFSLTSSMEWRLLEIKCWC